MNNRSLRLHIMGWGAGIAAMATASLAISMASGCASPAPAPVSQETTPVALGESLRKSLTNSAVYMPLASLHDTHVEKPGYSEYHNGSFCPDRGQADPQQSMADAFKSLCQANRGYMDGYWCHASAAPGQVLFAAAVYGDNSPNRCFDTYQVSEIVVVQPKGDPGNTEYLGRLHELGYRSDSGVSAANNQTFVVGWSNTLHMPPGYYALVEKQNDTWHLIAFQDEPIAGRQNEHQEVLYLNQDLNTLEPYFQEVAKHVNQGTVGCSALDPKSTTYTACNSALMRVKVGATVARNAVVGVLTLGLGAGSEKSVDQDLVLKIAKDTDLLAVATAKRPQFERAHYLARYHSAYQQAQSAADFAAFVRIYGNDDPDNLVPGAKLQGAAAQQQAEQEQTQRAQEQARQAKAEADARAARIANVNFFRRNLQIGTETNCGPVLEIKVDLIKVYQPIQNYGNEHWLRLSSLFPESYDCRFVNGGYLPPEP